MSIPLSWFSPKSEFWRLESILNRNQNKFVKAKRQQTPTQNPARNWHWNGIFAILLVERGITPPPQPIRVRTANTFEARTFTIWPVKRSDLEFIIWLCVVMTIYCLQLVTQLLSCWYELVKKIGKADKILEHWPFLFEGITISSFALHRALFKFLVHYIASAWVYF